jgi:hypothetical protein
MMNCFCQSAETIMKVNKLTKPFCISRADSFYQHGYYKETDLDGDHVNEIVVSAIDTADEENKIFIFKLNNGNLKIIDSSSAYIVDGRGPDVAVKNDTLEIYHNFHHGNYDFEYKFNRSIQKFELVSMGLTYLDPHEPDEDHGIVFEQTYDVIKHTLFFHSYLYKIDDSNDKEIKSIDKTIIQNKNLERSLFAFRDPIEDDSDYNSVFITDGPVYDEMMNYK